MAAKKTGAEVVRARYPRRAILGRQIRRFYTGPALGTSTWITGATGILICGIEGMVKRTRGHATFRNETMAGAKSAAGMCSRATCASMHARWASILAIEASSRADITSKL